ncbi:hypothetical protein [Salmonella enterica]|uniref:Uncharacterized protein n=2 Tax=Salmonella enterica TaxID=28901 RepID=A0A379SDJ1_SALER|nr:hypothetical protein [Salmonella enterica]ECC1656870.1 hypothetical protein [Salmonella enterica subsp. salamae]ECW9289641.1 hypothetical protein [Salmonella enterica subsp. enterica serovar Enteritidis]EDH8286194.1 hypothetical protein [Salmonella enterica subsp. enterica serovar Livingstone]ASG90752.1 hypothetical protein LFZ47_25180 [Salmonella enterica subsp. salamae serovar 55:k:z39 str. 1315K]EAY1659291.1 hypothetical protein [Salmonella enterica]
MLINKILNVGIIVSLSIAGTNLYHYLQGRNATQGIVSCSLPTGDFNIIPRDGRLDAVNTETGMTLGVPERVSDDHVVLVTHGGKVWDVTDCLGEKKLWFAPRWPDTATNQDSGRISQQ